MKREFRMSIETFYILIFLIFGFIYLFGLFTEMRETKKSNERHRQKIKKLIRKAAKL